MTRQEWIKAGIKTFIFMEGSCGESECNKLTDDIWRYLHSKDVVIKVDNKGKYELPEGLTRSVREGDIEAAVKITPLLAGIALEMKRDYCAVVEPLI